MSADGKFMVEDLVWHTHDGRELRLGDMGDEHLRNAIGMLARQAERLDAAALRTLRYADDAPDGAAAAAAQEADGAMTQASINDRWAECMRLVLVHRGHVLAPHPSFIDRILRGMLTP